MVMARRLSDICRDLAETAAQNNLILLARILSMAALEASDKDVRHEDGRVQDFLVGSWDWDIVNDRLYADARFARMFGITPEEAFLGPPRNEWHNAVHPDDQDRVAKAIAKAVQSGDVYSIEYRLVTRGEVRWVYARGKCTLDKEGKAIRFPGALVDITHEKMGENEFSIAPR